MKPKKEGRVNKKPRKTLAKNSRKQYEMPRAHFTGADVIWRGTVVSPRHSASPWPSGCESSKCGGSSCLYGQIKQLSTLASSSHAHYSTVQLRKKQRTKLPNVVPGLSQGAVPQVPQTSHSLPTQDFSSSLKGRTTFQLQTSLQRAAELYKDLLLFQEYLRKKKPNHHPRNLEVILPALLQPGSPPPPPY